MVLKESYSKAPSTGVDANDRLALRGRMHPVIRIVSFLVLGGFLALGGGSELLLGAGVLFFSYALSRARHYPTAWPLLRRMRWLFLSLLILYFWFTPGRPLFPFPGMPTLEGMEEGLLRIASLVALVMAVNLLLQTTRREQLLSAMLWLAGPLRLVGVPHHRLAVRLVLALETVIEAQGMLKARTISTGMSHNPVAWISVTAADLFQEAIQRAEAAPCEAIPIPDYGPPPAYQWFYPFVLGGIFWMVG